MSHSAHVYSSSAPVYSAPAVSYPVETGVISDGCSSCSGGSTIYSTPVYDGGSSVVPTEGSVIEHGASRSVSGEVLLTVNVPNADAKVFVNGNATTSVGTTRQFASRGLQQGKLYDYEIRVESNVNGRLVSHSKKVSLRSGEDREVRFDAHSVESNQPVATVLTLKLPEDAKVLLAGNATSATGAERVYRTSQLAPGQLWSNYVVEVQVERNGEKLVKQKVINLVGGQEYELSFEFESPKIAMR
jgi:uncharacterized protein (TIGR03000 family)